MVEFYFFLNDFFAIIQTKKHSKLSRNPAKICPRVPPYRISGSHPLGHPNDIIISHRNVKWQGCDKAPLGASVLYVPHLASV